MTINRKYPIGAEMIKNKGVHFRVWAPDHKKVDLALESTDSETLILPMKKEKNGYFSLLTKKAKEGTLYRYRLAGSLYSDPASRYQPFGPAGSSCVVNADFPWTDSKWPGVKPQGHVAYEMHIGTFTQEGTFNAASEQLNVLAELGITLIEMLPVGDFPGHFGWGYDGVRLIRAVSSLRNSK